MNPEDIEKLKEENERLKKENLVIKAERLSLKQLNKLITNDYKGLKNKKEILKKLKFINSDQEEKFNNLHYFEDGEMASLKWILGFSEDTKIEEIIERVEQIV